MAPSMPLHATAAPTTPILYLRYAIQPLPLRRAGYRAAAVSNAVGDRRTTRMTAVVHAADGRRTTGFFI